MSTVVSARLAEIAARGRERRRLTSAIRQDSHFWLERAHHLTAWQGAFHGEGMAGPVRAAGSTGVAIRDQGTAALAREAIAPDVLDQVRALLHELEAQHREVWSDEDTLLLRCFQQIFELAQRKGYSLEDLQAVLRSLRPR